ncbi:response regulator transcription factor [Paenibacillus sacheonensis]|uniref:Response regulator n=1 Tax=Paenibacillus sacheonensis TaxID=742054 RepID=A0A7X5BZ22_9BACL|nr:response regulator [Paenibacillus sacheonensis]MBM7565201.1 YesN/AraC family two-component response regulator [Paenibacillus sacheonensis]NBC70021.1 response regulator [Paenibacillus sacheonensis]
MYKLLIVDDEPQILEGMKATLDWEKYGFGQIETSETYEGAIAKSVEFMPDLAIFDVCIGKKRGYDAIHKLNELRLPAKYIIMSGYGEFQYALEALRCGAKDYLLKPVDRTKLQHLVERIIVEDLHGTVEGADCGDLDMDPVLGVRYDSLSKLTNRILLIVKAEYDQNINLKSVAERFRMNGTYLGQLFLKEAHMKFSEYLMAYRMLRAQEHIQNTDEKIANIALSVGYPNVNYFYSHFHAYFGKSPSDLRKKE